MSAKMKIAIHNHKHEEIVSDEDLESLANLVREGFAESNPLYKIVIGAYETHRAWLVAHSSAWMNEEVQ
jgi:hypothetical protein